MNNNVMTLIHEGQSVGSVDISDPEGAFEEMLRISRGLPGLVWLDDSRNYVTLREGEVRSVVFYDCFWELPETREEQAFRAMVDAICEKASLSARIVCREYHEYIAAINSLALYEANFLRSVSMSGTSDNN